MLQQGGIEAHGTEEVRGDGGFDRDQIGSLAEQIFGTYDAGTVENDVKFGNRLVMSAAKDLIAAGFSISRTAVSRPGFVVAASSRACLRRPATIT